MITRFLDFLNVTPWTTSKHGFKGKEAIFTGGNAIDQQSDQKQYFQPFSRPCLIQRDAVTEDEISTMFIHSEEYAAFIAELKAKYDIK